MEELLRIETHYRLMNTFAILCAILERELNTSDPRSRVALDRSVRIISAHSALHRCLAFGTPRSPVALGEYVKLSRCLSEAVLEPMGVTCEAVTDEGFMPAVQAERLRLVLCELVINAAKHAVPRKRTGMVRASKLLAMIMDGAARLPITEADSRMPLPWPASAHRSSRLSSAGSTVE